VCVTNHGMSCVQRVSWLVYMQVLSVRRSMTMEKIKQEPIHNGPGAVKGGHGGRGWTMDDWTCYRAVIKIARAESKPKMDQVKARHCKHLVDHQVKDMEDTHRHRRLCVVTMLPRGFGSFGLKTVGGVVSRFGHIALSESLC
jgi:hypothetical protein